MNGQKRYVRSSEVVLRRVAGELLLVPLGPGGAQRDSQSAEFFVVNESAELLWESLANAATIDELATALQDRYAIPLDGARRDAEAFLNDLLSVGAVTVMESANGVDG